MDSNCILKLEFPFLPPFLSSPSHFFFPSPPFPSLSLPFHPHFPLFPSLPLKAARGLGKAWRKSKCRVLINSQFCTTKQHCEYANEHTVRLTCRASVVSHHTGSGESDSDRYLLGTAIRTLWIHTPVSITCKHFWKAEGLKSRRALRYWKVGAWVLEPRSLRPCKLISNVIKNWIVFLTLRPTIQFKNYKFIKWDSWSMFGTIGLHCVRTRNGQQLIWQWKKMKSYLNKNIV